MRASSDTYNKYTHSFARKLTVLSCVICASVSGRGPLNCRKDRSSPTTWGTPEPPCSHVTPSQESPHGSNPTQDVCSSPSPPSSSASSCRRMEAWPGRLGGGKSGGCGVGWGGANGGGPGQKRGFYLRVCSLSNELSMGLMVLETYLVRRSSSVLTYLPWQCWLNGANAYKLRSVARMSSQESQTRQGRYKRNEKKRHVPMAIGSGGKEKIGVGSGGLRLGGAGWKGNGASGWSANGTGSGKLVPEWFKFLKCLWGGCGKFFATPKFGVYVTFLWYMHTYRQPTLCVTQTTSCIKFP